MRQTFNRILAIALAVVLCVGISAVFATPVSAASGTCGASLNWSLENGVLTISGSGAMTSYAEYNMPPWLADAERIQRVVVQQGATTISPLAFYHCENLTAVSLASSVQTIGELAFAGCSSLKQVTMPGVVRLERGCFHSCVALTNVILPQSLQYIGEEAFFRCKDLGGITIPSGVKHMGDGVFSYCDGLATVFVEASLPDLPAYTFYGCDSLSQLWLPNSIDDVGSNALVGCENLYHVDYNGSADVRHEINQQLEEPATPSRDVNIQKDVTYRQTENAVITSTNKSQTGTSVTPMEQTGSFINATVTGGDGWSDVSDAVNSSVGSGYDPEIDIWVQDDPTIPDGALDGLSDKDVTITVQTDGNLQWQIIMKDQSTDSLQGQQQLNASMTPNEKGAYSNILGDADSYTVTLGSTSVNSTILVPLGSETARQVATLYIKNGKKLEKLTSVIVDDLGKAAFSLAGTEAGEYVIALNVQDIPQEEVVIPQALHEEYDITYGATLTDAYGNQYVLTGRVNKLGIGLGTLTAIVAGILVGTAILVGVVMTVLNKQKQRRYRTGASHRENRKKH